MLELQLPEVKLYNRVTREFVELKPITLQLEHSLLSVSKWESKWHKIFLSANQKTPEELNDYVRCMVIQPSKVDSLYFSNLTVDVVKQIEDYIENPMTATKFKKKPATSREGVSSERIYCMMIQHNIPSEYQKWHLKRLMTLIQVCNIENNPKKKKHNPRDVLRSNYALNRKRLEEYGTTG